MALQFEITNGALQTLQSINLQTNFAEVKTALQEMVKPYTQIIVTEDGIAQAKSDRANIHKIGKAIDDYRKMVKKSYLASYAPFEANCKELIEILGGGANNLDRQIKAFEESAKTDKVEILKCFFWENVGDLADIVSWDDVADKRYANATYSAENARQDILQKLNKFRIEISTIRGMKSEHEIALIDFYKQTHDFAATMQKAQAYEAIKRNEEERHAAQAAEEKPHDEETHSASENAAEEAQELQVLDFRVWVTQEQKLALRDFLKSNGIKYGKVV